MKQLRRIEPLNRPVKVLQFGEGNFMRAFIDWMIERMNHSTDFNAAVQLVKPRPSEKPDPINSQDGLYTVVLRGVKEGSVVDTMETIHCVKGCLNPTTQWNEVIRTACLPELRFVFSNTTEAGIEYRPGVDTFPAKIARVIAARAKTGLPGLVFLPCELIEQNGDKLKEFVSKYLDGNKEALDYLHSACIFCNTLVDRIVSGYPQKDAPKYWDKLGFEDRLLVCGEPFHFFAIEGPAELENELPFTQAGLNVLLTADLSPYRTRKVRFLNGAHTASVLAAHMAGFTFVDEMVRDPYFHSFLQNVLFDEIMPTVNLPDADKKAYAESILERFANPYAQHRLLSIALNSVAKWRVRILPTILDYRKLYGTLPPNLLRSMASLIDFYRTCPIQDSPEVIAFFQSNPSLEKILARVDFWEMDLNLIPNLTETVRRYLKSC